MKQDHLNSFREINSKPLELELEDNNILVLNQIGRPLQKKKTRKASMIPEGCIHRFKQRNIMEIDEPVLLSKVVSS